MDARLRVSVIPSPRTWELGVERILWECARTSWVGPLPSSQEASALLLRPTFFSLFSPHSTPPSRSLVVSHGLKGRGCGHRSLSYLPLFPHRILAPQRLHPFAPSSLPCECWVPRGSTASWARAGAIAHPRACPCSWLRSLPLAWPQCPGACCPPLATARGAFWPRILGAGE